MRGMFFAITLLMTMLFFFSAKGYAEKASDPVASNPFNEKVTVLAKELAKELNEAEAEDLGVTINNFGMVRAVKIARADVARAVEACGKKNPDLKKDIDGRFAQWTGAVDPVVKKQEKDMKKAIDGGLFKSKDKVNEYLGLIDKMAAHADAQINKQVVTTPEVCTGLMKSMDRTEEKMTKILTDISWPAPQKADQKKE